MTLGTGRRLNSRRAGGTTEARIVMPESTDLAPDAKTQYRLEVAVQDYNSATFSRVVTGDAHLAVAFKAVPGAERPPLPPNPVGRTIIVSRPAPKDGEIINTEQNPGKVP